MMTEDGSLELKIGRFPEFVAKNFECQLFSDPTYIHGFVWRIAIKQGEEPKKRLVLLECTGGDDIPNWSCKASVTLRIVSQKDGEDDHIVTKDHKFSKENDSRQLLTKMKCDVLVDPKYRYIKDNTVIIRVHVKAEVSQSVR